VFVPGVLVGVAGDRVLAGPGVAGGAGTEGVMTPGQWARVLEAGRKEVHKVWLTDPLGRDPVYALQAALAGMSGEAMEIARETA
jgi:hypothetical protein